MIFHVLLGPVGVILAGLVVLFGTFLLLRSRVRPRSLRDDGDRHRQLETMIAQLQSEKEEISTLLAEANQTTRHLSHMIDSFERTFYSSRPEDGSVAEVFNSLRRDAGRQRCHLEGRTL